MEKTIINLPQDNLYFLAKSKKEYPKDTGVIEVWLLKEHINDKGNKYYQYLCTNFKSGFAFEEDIFDDKTKALEKASNNHEKFQEEQRRLAGIVKGVASIVK